MVRRSTASGGLIFRGKISKKADSIKSNLGHSAASRRCPGRAALTFEMRSGPLTPRLPSGIGNLALSRRFGRLPRRDLSFRKRI
jgi:hypothetical protein